MVEAREAVDAGRLNQQARLQLDPYRTLQLHATAPHDLVERAYWSLVSRAKDRANGGGSMRLGQLNDAYATLINGERRLAFDAEHGHKRTSRRPDIVITQRGILSRKHQAHTRLTHYQLLHVDFDASIEIIDVAYSFARSQMMGSDIRTILERKLVDDAYATLANPQRRAQYDRSVKRAPGPANGARRPAAASAPAAVAEPPVVAEAEAAGEASPVAESAPVETASPVAEPVAQPDPEPVSVPEHLAVVPPHTYVQPVLPAATIVDSPAPSPVKERRDGRRWPFRRATSADGEAPRQTREQQRAEVIEAEGRRLLELGLAGDAPSHREPELEQYEPDQRLRNATFVFVEGPQRGQRIALTAGSLILGASESADVMLQNPDGMIGAGHVRVWHRESDYMLHQLDSFSVTYVNGERLDLRLVILEQGDEIRIGPHALVFEQGPPVSEAAPVANVSDPAL